MQPEYLNLNVFPPFQFRPTPHEQNDSPNDNPDEHNKKPSHEH
jgi:hypothetical protein